MKRILVVCLLLCATILFADSGGPDLFGYTWVDSRDGLPFEWYEISETGERLSISSSDDAVYTATLSQPFEFYGTEHTELSISTNGVCAFGRMTYITYSISTFPSSSTPPYSIGLMWMDLRPPYSGTETGIYFQEFDDKIVIEYKGIPEIGYDANRNTFQLVLYPGSKTIMINYLDVTTVTSTYRTAWIGTVNADQTDALICGTWTNADMSFLQDSLSIRIRATPTASAPYYNDCSDFDDFQLPEDVESGWEWGGPSSVGPSYAHSGSHCIGTDMDDNYGNGVTWTMMTPDLDLANTTYPILDFWTWYEMEDGVDGGYCRISTDDGESWHLIESEQGYPATMGSSSPISGFDAYTGNSDGWEYVSFDLQDFAGSMCKFELDFYSNSSVANAGWYLDDLGLHEQYGVVTGFVDLAYTDIDDSVTIELIHDGRSTISEYDGFFWFDSVKIDTTYIVKFSKPGYLPDSLTGIELSRLDTTDLYIILAPELYFNDFEEDASGYLATPTTGWEWGIPNPDITPMHSHSDSLCWGTVISGNYRDDVDWTLDFTIDLGPLERPSLRFWQWYDLAGEYAGQFFDGCNVKVSVDSGETFDIIAPDPRYEFSYDGIVAPHNDYMAGQPCWGGSGYGDYWHYMTFDLIPYAHNVVTIRFELASDGVGRSRGWYLDDLQISDNWEAIAEPVVKTEKPDNYGLSSYPNPFNTTCDIVYEIPAGVTSGTIDIYNTYGKLITRAPIAGVEGTHTFTWDANGLPSGIYTARVTVDNKEYSTQMVLVK